MSVHMNDFASHSTSANHLRLIKDKSNYYDKLSVGTIIFMVIIFISVLSPVGLKSWPINLAAPHLQTLARFSSGQL